MENKYHSDHQETNNSEIHSASFDEIKNQAEDVEYVDEATLFGLDESVDEKANDTGEEEIPEAVNFTLIDEEVEEAAQPQNEEPAVSHEPIYNTEASYRVMPDAAEELGGGNSGSGKQSKGKKKKGPRGAWSRKATALGVTGLVLVSGLFGFGGGLAAMKLAGNDTPVMYQSVDRTSATSGEDGATGGGLTTQQIAETAGNSVVEIKTEIMQSTGRIGNAVAEGAGSGVIVTTDGYIITNNHVIDGASKITVTLKSGESHEAKVVGTDAQTDVALLKIDAKDLQPAVLGDSSTLTVGEKAVAIGNPLGELGGTVTEGIVSALDREITIDGETMNLLQTSAAINPGNSGGGLFNENGELIGLVVAKTSGSDVEGLGFAIPINDVKSVVESLTTDGYVKGRPALGVSIADLSSADVAMQYKVNETGIYISEVNAGSAAEKAGLQAGDKVVSIDGEALSDVAFLKKIINNHQVGDTITVQVKRDGKMVDVKVTLEESQANNATTQEQQGGNNDGYSMNPFQGN